MNRLGGTVNPDSLAGLVPATAIRWGLVREPLHQRVKSNHDFILLK